jgi:hypothetical protein
MGLIGALVRRVTVAVWPPHFRRVTYVAEMADVPDQLARHVMMVVGSRERPKWAVFECPCRRRHRVLLNLQPRQYPSWKLSVDHGRPTIWPSVDVRGLTRCHYFVAGGKVSNVRAL